MLEHSAFVLLEELFLPALCLDQIRKMQLSYPFHTIHAPFPWLCQVGFSAEALF